MMNALKEALVRGEEGHGQPLIGTLAGGAGAILLAIGAANDSGALAIIGGIVLAIALTLTLVVNHVTVDYDVYKRLETLEKK